MGIKILLWQAREADDASRVEERESFADVAGVPVADITPFDLLTTVPRLEDVKKYDALMVGGSADYYVSKGNLPNKEVVRHVLQQVVDCGHPTFASCFGFQLMVDALGGEIVHDADNTQVGTYTLTLTENGRLDALFGYLPPTFKAQLGRKDRASHLPSHILNLASSEAASYQALRVPDKPIWATQFHPELTKETNLRRFQRYMNGYQAVLKPAAIQTTLDRFNESPEANGLIKRFLTLVFG